MAQRLMSFPMVVWEVMDAYTVKKQTSSAFNFLGVNWKLQFDYSCTNRGQFIKVFLRRIGPCSKIPCLFCAKTSVVVDNAYSCFETHASIDTSFSNEWCVWNEDRQTISSCVADSTLMFVCYIQPESKWREILHESSNKGMKLSELNPDIDSLHEDLRNLFDKHVEADVVFECKGENIYAHRAMLSSRCKVMAAMFQTDMKESREGVIHITDTEPTILRVFLRYLYTGDLPRLSLDSSMNLYFVADKYGMDILKKNCVFSMMDSLEVDASEGISESSNEENLESKIRSRLRNIREVLSTGNWKFMNEEQLKMSMDAFHGFVKDIYSELGTGQETDIKSLNQDVQIKK